MKRNSLIIILIILSGMYIFPETKEFNFSSDKTSIMMAKGKEKTVLIGNARITSEATDIHADTIELFGKDLRYARCTGNVTAIDENQGILLKTNDLFYDRDKKRLVIKGYAEMIDQKNEIVVKGGYFENLSEEDITIIQIGVRILKASDESTLTARSEFARYDRSNNTLDLSGMPVVFKDNDVFKATRITINLDTDEIKLYGDVSGTVTSTENSNSEAQ